MYSILDDEHETGAATSPPWPSEWLRGLMEICVLKAIADGSTYGYAIATALERGGLGAPKGGTLYPLLARLEKTGKVRTHWGAGDGGPGRKFYELTEGGRAYLDQMTDAWATFRHTVSHFVAETTNLTTDNNR